MKNLFSAMLLLVLLSTTASAQWVNQMAWPDSFYKGQNHAMTVDGVNKVWVSNFASDTTIINGADTLRPRTIKIYNPDGSPAPFSPIIFPQGPGINDTLRYATLGMRTDHNGDVLLTTGLSAGPQLMYRFNHESGAAMNKVNIAFAGTTTPTAPAVDDAGNIYVGPVFPNFPIKMYDPDFTFIGNAVDSTKNFSRSLEVSRDGLTLYHPLYPTKAIYIYNRPNEFVTTFDSIGVILGPAPESITFNLVTGNLWFSGGSFNDQPDPTVGVYPYTPNTWYAYDLSTNNVVDSLKWEFTVPNSSAERPRALAFSLDGNTAYIGCFAGAGYPLVQKVINTGTSVEDPGYTVVNGYKLSQNYPNPFNPSTRISFELPDGGFVTLKVYDMLGREVALLVNNEMTSGAHTVNFNAANLSSGTYFYQLSSNGNLLTNKMVLLK